MPKALSKEEYTKLIVAQLGGTVVDIELESDIGTFLDAALIRVKPYMNTTKLLTVPAQRTVDFRKYDVNVYTVVHVFRGDASSVTASLTGGSDSSLSGGDSTTTESGGTTTNSSFSYSSGWSDDSYLFNPFFINYYGLIDGSSTSESLAVSMLTSQIINTVTGGGSSDIEFYQDDPYLYVDIRGGESEITIQYRPDYQSVEEVTEPFWINYIMNVATALTKIALGRARGKYNISNLPYELDGDTILSEGISELETLTQELKENHEFWFIED